MARLRKLRLDEMPAIQEVRREVRCLYVVREDRSENFKIGIAGHPLRRLSGLQAGNPRKLMIVALYAGTDADCSFLERSVLRYFKARPGSEWILAEGLEEITRFLDTFCEGQE